VAKRDDRATPLAGNGGALALAYEAARRQWEAAPEALPERFAECGPSALASTATEVNAESFARALYRWTGLTEWTTAFSTLAAARLALLCAVDEFHHRYGTGRRIVLVPASRAVELARPIALARYRCVAVAEATPGVPQSAALAAALNTYGRDVAAVWQTHLGDPATLERRHASWQPLLDLGVKFLVEGASWSWAFGRVPLRTLGIDGAALPFPETVRGLGPRGVAVGASEALAALLPVPPAEAALTDRTAAHHFLAGARALVERFTPVLAPRPETPSATLATKHPGKTVDERRSKAEDTNRLP
jgi:hypothetical protein